MKRAGKRLGVMAVLGLLLMAALPLSPAASAQAVDRVRFAVGPILMVWDERGQRQTGETLSIDLGTSSSSDESQDILVTGLLQPVSFAPAEPIDQTFAIASNTAFRIEAVSQGAWDISVTLDHIGPLAQPVGSDRTTLLIAGAPTVLFRAERRTARDQGAAWDQSIRLRIQAKPEGPHTEGPIRLRIISED